MWPAGKGILAGHFCVEYHTVPIDRSNTDAVSVLTATILRRGQTCKQRERPSFYRPRLFNLMNSVFAYWDSSEGAPSHQAEIFSLWEKSWKKRGWEPRLLAEHMAVRNPKYRTIRKSVSQKELRTLALLSVKGTWICPIHVLNFSFAPAPFSQKYIEWYDRPGWKTSPLVDFGHSAAASDVLDCGRSLRI